MESQPRSVLLMQTVHRIVLYKGDAGTIVGGVELVLGAGAGAGLREIVKVRELEPGVVSASIVVVVEAEGARPT